MKAEGPSGIGGRRAQRISSVSGALPGPIWLQGAVLHLPAAGDEQRHPIRAEVHVHQELHAAVMASSSSSTRSAA
jgi:hypothetical protein